MKPFFFGISIALHGVQPLYDRRHLERVLLCFEEHDFLPTKFGFDERGGAVYKREGALALLADPGVAFEQTDLFLHRKGTPKYQAAIALGKRAEISVDFDAKVARSASTNIFALADALANAFEPDWGVVRLAIDLRDGRNGDFSNADERDVYLLTEAGYAPPKDYNRHGPHGLAMRTYVGPFFAEQLGRDRLESLPLVVDRLPWGGYRVDLVPEPWFAEVPALLDAWRRGMAHLSDANVFATPEMAPSYAVHWTRGTNAKLRRDA